jgi:uncharacterized membrane protein
MKKLLFFYRELMATFWFVPVLIIILSVFLPIVIVTLDNSIAIDEEGWYQFFLVKSTDSARSILTTISGAMIGVAGTVFSMTLVVLTLASSQFGPRLIKNFMYVRLNQVVLGSYVATYLYCLQVLNVIKDNGDYVFVPSISILVAILITIFNIILLIIFIHNIATSIQADKVIADISDFTSKQLDSLFAEKMGEAVEEDQDIDIYSEMLKYQNQISILSPKAGYLQYIDSESLMEVVQKQDAFLELNHRTGSYLVKDLEVGIIHVNSSLEKGELDEILDQFVIGKTKTSQQDLEFSIYQMVEIAARALSPGVNDPFTAITCIDNLTAAMTHLAQAKFPSKYRFDKEGRLRIIADVLDFEGVMDAAFNQIRQFSGGSTAVIIRLMEALTIIFKFTKKESHKKAVQKHAEMVLNKGKLSIKEDNDLQDLVEISNKILG